MGCHIPASKDLSTIHQGDDVAGRRVPTTVELIALFTRRCGASSSNARFQQRQLQREP